LLADPALAKLALANSAFVSRCNHCNECVSTIESPQGIHCTQF
jgi:hypothetical protein